MDILRQLEEQVDAVNQYIENILRGAWIAVLLRFAFLFSR